jgi:RNA polymerase sigma-B factor
MAPSTVEQRLSSRLARYDSAALLERYFEHRDPRDREELLQRFRPLAMHLSRRYFSAGEREDLQQIATLALLKAIDRFDPSRGIAFSSFAVPTILGELKRYFRDQGWSVRVPRPLQELAPRVERAAEDLFAELGRSPTVNELAARCDISAEIVLEARALKTAHRAISLDVPAGDDETSGRLDLIGSEDDAYTRVEQDVDIERMLETLPERERAIIHMRFFDDLTQREIADRVGVSQMHVSRLLRAALTDLSQNALAAEHHARGPLQR